MLHLASWKTQRSNCPPKHHGDREGGGGISVYEGGSFITWKRSISAASALTRTALHIQEGQY